MGSQCPLVRSCDPAGLAVISSKIRFKAHLKKSAIDVFRTSNVTVVRTDGLYIEVK